MGILLHSMHPLYELTFSVDVKDRWIIEYLQFYFNLSENCKNLDREIIHIQTDVEYINCRYKDNLLRTKLDIEHITGKMTSWIIGIINDILFEHNVYVLHGASCVYKTKTLLLLGHKGVGKSTLLYKILTAGGQYLSDDNIYYSCNDTSICYSDIGMRLKNDPHIDRDYFNLLKMKSTNIKFVPPNNRFVSLTKPTRIYLLSKDCDFEFQETNLFEFLPIVLSNMKNSNSGRLDIQNLIRLHSIANAIKINSFNLSDLDDLIR